VSIECIVARFAGGMTIFLDQLIELGKADRLFGCVNSSSGLESFLGITKDIASP